MLIEVYCDDQKVFEGMREQFLAENDHDKFLTDILSELNKLTKVEFHEHSGHWKIVKKEEGAAHV